MQCEPARTLRQAQAQPPCSDRADGSDERDPAPARYSERIVRYQQPPEQGDHRHNAELDELIVGERPAALARRHELRQKGIDGDLLQPHADGGDEAPQIDRLRRGLKGHDGRRQ